MDVPEFKAMMEKYGDGISKCKVCGDQLMHGINYDRSTAAEPPLKLSIHHLNIKSNC